MHHVQEVTLPRDESCDRAVLERLTGPQTERANAIVAVLPMTWSVFCRTNTSGSISPSLIGAYVCHLTWKIHVNHRERRRPRPQEIRASHRSASNSATARSVR